MTDKANGNGTYIFHDSIFGVSVGVPSGVNDEIKVDFGAYELPGDAKTFDKYRIENNHAPGKEVANVDVKYNGENPSNDLKVILRVFITEEEYWKGFNKIFAYKSFGWQVLPTNGFKRIPGGRWFAYIETYLPGGDPPIAVG